MMEEIGVLFLLIGNLFLQLFNLEAHDGKGVLLVLNSFVWFALVYTIGYQSEMSFQSGRP